MTSLQELLDRSEPFCLNCGSPLQCSCGFQLTEEVSWYKTTAALYHRRSPLYFERLVAEAESQLAKARAQLPRLPDSEPLIGNRKIRFAPEEMEPTYERTNCLPDANQE